MLIRIQCAADQMERQIFEIAQRDRIFWSQVELRISIPGIGQYAVVVTLAEISDFSRFKKVKQLAAIAGIDPAMKQSGTFDSRSRRISKRGSPHLRRTLFQITSVSLQRSDPANPVFRFMDRKWAEGKHFYVYMVAGAAKLLRIYYARVKAHSEISDTDTDNAAFAAEVVFSLCESMIA